MHDKYRILFFSRSGRQVLRILIILTPQESTTLVCTKVWRIRIMLIRIRIQDVKTFVTDPDLAPG